MMSYSDVLTGAMGKGLSYDEADDLAQYLCPEYRSVSVARFTNEVNRILS
jgi:hypothetical protein